MSPCPLGEFNLFDNIDPLEKEIKQPEQTKNCLH